MRTRNTLCSTALAVAVGISAATFFGQVAEANQAQADSRRGKPDAAGPREIKSRELMAEREGLKLKLYEKWRAGNEESWKQNGKVILLVHGATWASRCTFDPDPDHGYSMMEMLADAGYDVFAVDLHGYGRSERSDGDWTDSQSAAKDVEAAVEFIRALRWVERIHLFGYQWGAQPAALFASQKPHKVGRLALLGMRYKLIDKGASVPPGPLRTLGQQASLLKPEDGDLDPEFVRRRAQVCRSESASAPNGAIIDLTKPSPVDPGKLKVPTLVLQGERDGSPELTQDRLAFFQQLASPGKWFTFLPGVGKYAPIERTRTKFDQVLLSFLDQGQ